MHIPKFDDAELKKRVVKATIAKIDELVKKSSNYMTTWDYNGRVYEKDNFRLTTYRQDTKAGSIIETFKLEGKEKTSDNYVDLLIAERAIAKDGQRYNILPTIYIDSLRIWDGGIANLSTFLGADKDFSIAQ